MNITVQNRNTSGTSTGGWAWYWAGIVVLFVIVHATQDRVSELGLAAGRLPTLKESLFLVAACLVAWPIVVDARRLLSATTARQRVTLLALSIGLAAALACLVFPVGLGSMGHEYARLSQAPFSQETSINSKRLLVTAVAHALFLRGGWLFFGFSTLIFLAFLAAMCAWLTTHAPVRFWQLVSLATCSFAIYQLQFPGYPDAMVFLLFVLVMLPGIGGRAKLSCLVLALVAHEASVFVGIVLAWRYLERNLFRGYVSTVIVYSAIWLMAFRFDVRPIVAMNPIMGASSLEWVLRAPLMEALGVFIAFKATWVLLVLGLAVAIRRGSAADAGFIAGCAGGAAVMTVLGVDTSRLMGFAFPGLLVAVQTIRQHMRPRVAESTLSATLAVNLLIPSIYVGLNTGVLVRPGLYRQLYNIERSIHSVFPE